MAHWKLGFGVLLVAGALAACRSSDQHDFWAAPAEYILTLRVTNRASLTPELERAFAPLVDTTTVLLKIDSVAEDSLHGSYVADFRHFGVAVGAVGPEPQLVAGEFKGDSLALVLTPNATDAGMILRGVFKGASVSGRWMPAGQEASGTFVLVHR